MRNDESEFPTLSTAEISLKSQDVQTINNIHWNHATANHSGN